MKKKGSTVSFLILTLIFMLFVSCSGKKYERYGIDFESASDEIEKTLDIKTGQFTDNDIKLICAEEGKICTSYEMNSVQFKGENAESFENELKASENWKEYPFPNGVASMLVNNGVTDSFDLNTIKQGYYTIAEINENGGSIKRVTGGELSSCKYCIIGIYDSQTTTLYQIIIEN